MNSDIDNTMLIECFDFSLEQIDAWLVKEAKKVAKEKLETMEYLKTRFPDVSEDVFKTDSIGHMCEDVVKQQDVYRASVIDQTCERCDGSFCESSELLGAYGGRPVVRIKTSPKGFNFLSVGWTCGLPCKFRPLSWEFGRRVEKSGLYGRQTSQTFGSYVCTIPENRNAKTEALAVAKKGTCLIILGEPYVGKTHLATAIAIEVMRGGKQAICWNAWRLMDEFMRTYNSNDEDYLEYLTLQDELTSVDCLVLDGLREWIADADRNREMWCLFTIVAKRCTRGMQTIIAANATNLEEMRAWDDYMPAIVSRMMECGSYVLLKREPGFEGVYPKVQQTV